MQRIYACRWTVEEYVTTEAHRQIICESICANCFKAVKLHRHGRYQRWMITLLAQVVLIWVARFLCPLCRRTLSYLPDFAFSYRPLQPESFQGFLEGQTDRPDVRSYRARLRIYQRRIEAFCPELIRTVGSALGRPPLRPPKGLWRWIKKAGDGLRPLTRSLATDFRITLFGRYRCHQPGGP